MSITIFCTVEHPLDDKYFIYPPINTISRDPSGKSSKYFQHLLSHPKNLKSKIRRNQANESQSEAKQGDETKVPNRERIKLFLYPYKLRQLSWEPRAFPLEPCPLPLNFTHTLLNFAYIPPYSSATSTTSQYSAPSIHRDLSLLQLPRNYSTFFSVCFLED